MSVDITRYELPPSGITLLGYVVRRMHKTSWLLPVPLLLAAGRIDEALARIAMYAVSSSTSYGHAYYQPQFNSAGAEVAEADPATGAGVSATLVSTSPHYLISYTVSMPHGDLFTGSEEITGTTLGLNGLGMPAPSRFNFKSGNYTADLNGVLTSELTLSLIGRTRIRAFGSLGFSDQIGNSGRLMLDRKNAIQLTINGSQWQPVGAFSITRVTG